VAQLKRQKLANNAVAAATAAALVQQSNFNLLQQHNSNHQFNYLSQHLNLNQYSHHRTTTFNPNLLNTNFTNFYPMLNVNLRNSRIMSDSTSIQATTS
jgi:hypothetical protein